MLMNFLTYPMSTSSFIAANIVDLNCFLFNINLRGEEDKTTEEMEEEAANDIDDAFLKDVYPKLPKFR